MSKKDSNGLYSKTDLMDMTKDEQETILIQKLGLDEKQMALLKTEPERVKKILQLQKPIKMVTEEPKAVLNNDCPRCGKEMIKTGGGPSGNDYFCDDEKGGCGLRVTK